MASCGPPPPRAAATHAAAAPATAAARTCRCNTHCCCNTRCCNNLYRAKITPVPAVILCGGFPRYSSSSPHPQFDIDTHEDERRCNFQTEDVPYLSLVHEVAPVVPSAGRTRAKMACCLRCRDDEECHLYTHNDTKAFIRRSHKAS